jgi:RNA 3'-terminal phosphate cyclase (ATP)
MANPIILDGAQGEGGGQILRTALALSMVTGKPFRLVNIRAGRSRPGLMRQHLTAVSAAAQISNAETQGAAIGSTTLDFQPQRVSPGDYTFAIGSAGSTTLVFQTVLPALLLADGPSTLILEGGTHNPYAPPFDFIDRAFIPLINRMGPQITVSLQRPGFFPAGGGRFTATITPCAKLSPIEIPQRGNICRRRAHAHVAGLPGEIAVRELEQVHKQLNWADDELQISQLPTEFGPGNVLMLEITSEHANALFTAFGVKGASAEAVASDACQQARKYLADGAPVCSCLADQLLIPLALAGGGSFATLSPTRHTTTNAEVIKAFLDIEIEIKIDRRSTVIQAGK